MTAGDWEEMVDIPGLSVEGAAPWMVNSLSWCREILGLFSDALLAALISLSSRSMAIIRLQAISEDSSTITEPHNSKARYTYSRLAVLLKDGSIEQLRLCLVHREQGSGKRERESHFN